jgi:hypothetical protein
VAALHAAATSTTARRMNLSDESPDVDPSQKCRQRTNPASTSSSETEKRRYRLIFSEIIFF